MFKCINLRKINETCFHAPQKFLRIIRRHGRRAKILIICLLTGALFAAGLIFGILQDGENGKYSYTAAEPKIIEHFRPQGYMFGTLCEMSEDVETPMEG